MQHWIHKIYKVYINDAHKMTLTYFTTRSNLAAYAFKWEKLLQAFKGLTLQINRICMCFLYFFTPGDCLSVSRAYINVHNDYFQNIFFSETAEPIKAQFHGEPPREGGNKFHITCKWSRSHDQQDGRHAH